MSPAFTDPNNHAPAVTAADTWGDVEGCLTGPIVIEDFEEEFPAMLPLAELPPKRPRETSLNLIVPPNEVGLRIEPQIRRQTQAMTDTGDCDSPIFESIVRLSPEVPRPQKAPRQVAFHERPPRSKRDRRRHGEGHGWGTANRSSLRWISGLFIAIAGIVIASLGVLPIINEANASRPPEEELVIDKNDNSAEIIALNEMFSLKTEAAKIFMKFATSRSADEILPWLGNRKEVEKLIRSKPWSPLAPADWNPPSDLNWQAYHENGRPVGIFDVTLPNFTNTAFYFIIEDHQLKLDWKASTGYGTAEFADLAKGMGDGSEIRAIISKADFYTHGFPEAEYQSYQLFSPQEEESLWAYSRRGEPTDTELSRLLDKGSIIDEAPEQIKLTIRLGRFPDGGLPNQWLIQEILHNDWIQP